MMVSFEEFKAPHPPIVFEKQNPFSMASLIVGAKNPDRVERQGACKLSDKTVSKAIAWANKQKRTWCLSEMAAGAGVSYSSASSITAELRARGCIGTEPGARIGRGPLQLFRTVKKHPLSGFRSE